MTTAATTKTTSAPPPSRPKGKEIEAYLALYERKKELDRDARATAKEMAPLTEKFTAWLTAELAVRKRIGDPLTLVKVCGYVFSRVITGTFPAWKQLFIAKLGAEAAATATTETEPSVGLKIERE
jgi:hypothetical protein